MLRAVIGIALGLAIGVAAGMALTASEVPAAAPAADERPTAAVALGDSVLAGEGAGSYEPGTDGENGNWCHRSTEALVHKLAVADRAVNLACSGATSADVALGDAVHHAEGSQVRRLADVAKRYRVTTVVVQTGANDDPRFGDTMVDCVIAWLNPFGRGCRTSLREEWPARLTAMRPKVAAVLTDVRTVLRDAGYRDEDYELVVLSYASPVTEKMDHAGHGVDGCPLKLDDAAYGRLEAVPQLADALREVAGGADARFLDLSRATEGREACSGGDDRGGEWQRGLTVDPRALRVGTPADVLPHLVQQSFHPTAAGHARFASCLREFLTTDAATARCVPTPDGDLRLHR
ncbi:GDSL-type esterase/lipase family protein [Saccharothrix texasensis]|uniref:GDSL-like lipase/acylhydrolase family protein n=1 Tax=Saccharothrix texasensis TaxID=103734 RepID=A0A3N1GZK7_9PSEU|nr:GDSL-type esterase/lipase family protein [Saccharothrix texasensis]ROP35678.1 GDSL-like lipase/acylhydrolase family protein [Saccharothrix texasensis]